MITEEAKKEVIKRLENWVAEAPNRIVLNNQYIEARTLLMACKQDYLNEKGWAEIEFYVAMMGFVTHSEVKTKFPPHRVA
jgi:hypothetical protein